VTAQGWLHVTAVVDLYSSLKTERTARKVYRTRDDAKADVFDASITTRQA